MTTSGSAKQLSKMFHRLILWTTLIGKFWLLCMYIICVFIEYLTNKVAKIVLFRYDRGIFRKGKISLVPRRCLKAIVFVCVTLATHASTTYIQLVLSYVHEWTRPSQISTGVKNILNKNKSKPLQYVSLKFRVPFYQSQKRSYVHRLG
jgi:hypothetical protein